MTDTVYINGKYLPAADAKVSIFDRGFLFGDGVYEVLPVLAGKLIDQQHFLARLDDSLKAISLDWPCSTEKYFEILNELIVRNALREGYIYTQVTRGAAARDFSYPKDTPPTLMAFASAKDLLSNPLVASGVPVVTVADLRWKRRDIKSLNLLAQCMAKEQAKLAGGYEGWMVEDGYVTEGASSSAFIVKNGCIITRPLSNLILPGIRRRVILEAAPQAGFKIEQRLFTVAEAMAADEAFMSSATTFVLPITSIDGKPVANGKPGPISLALRELYIKLALQEAAAAV